MTRYFFDTRDNGSLITDEIGVELPTVEAAKNEAARSLAELALDVLPSKVSRDLAVEVRDDTHVVLRATLRFEAELVEG